MHKNFIKYCIKHYILIVQLLYTNSMLVKLLKYKQTKYIV